jgi:hypothetical protein
MSQAKEGGVSLPLEPASARKDAAFYAHSENWEEVWADSRVAEPRFTICRNGEMRIHARKALLSDYEVLRYTDQLESFGIKTDEDLRRWEAKGAEHFEWIHNPWFEVLSNSYSDQDLCEVFHDLDEAIAYAESLWDKYGADGNIWE